MANTTAPELSGSYLRDARNEAGVPAFLITGQVEKGEPALSQLERGDKPVDPGFVERYLLAVLGVALGRTRKILAHCSQHTRLGREVRRADEALERLQQALQN